MRAQMDLTLTSRFWADILACLTHKRSEASLHRWAESRAFLAEASQLLGSTLNYNKTLQNVTQLAVPRLADWCAIHAETINGGIDQLAIANVQLERSQWAQQIYEKYPARITDVEGVARVIRNGDAVMGELSDQREMAKAARSAEHLQLLFSLNCHSYICVPLKARGHTFGALSLISSQIHRYTADDLELAEDLGRRVAVAIDNALIYQESQRVNRVKDEFLATLSHELRTPLNIILGHAEILHDDVHNAVMLESVDAIHRNAQMQLQIVNDLLDVSAIITGKITLREQPVRLLELLKATAESVRLAAESKHVRIFLNLDCPALIVSGDAVRLQQVFWNLLANAVKFTPRGGLIEVNLMVADGFCTVTVSDSGRGIEPEFLPHVFERFRQEDSGMTRQFGGLGLGLAIVRHLVELHGGEVGATSHGRNLGSEFTVRLALSAQTP